MHDTTARTAAAAPAALATAEIVVGVPSSNHAGTVASVLRAAQAGLGEVFGGQSSLLVSADTGSSDGTREQVRGLRAENPTVVDGLTRTYGEPLSDHDPVVVEFEL